MSSSLALLAEAGKDREELFSAFHGAHYRAVYAAALRKVRDPEMAADVAQVVFQRAAKKGGELADPRWARAWLFQTAHYVALELLRKESAQKRIQEKYQQTVELENSNGPRGTDYALNSKMEKLLDHEREAIQLRYYEEKSFHEIAREVGISVHAAKKRVSRATERLRFLLRNDKPDIKGAILGWTWQTLLEGFRSGHKLLLKKTLLSLMAKIKTSVTVAALVAACLPGIYFYSQYVDLRKTNERLSNKLEELKVIPWTTLTSQSTNEESKHQEELNQLRNEVGVLRKQKSAMAILAAENETLKRKYSSMAESKGSENLETEAAKIEMIALMNEAKKGAMGAILFAESNNGNLPGDLQTMAQATLAQDPVSLEAFELMPNYKPVRITELKANASMTILFRSREVRLMPNGKYARAYSFLDGHSEIHSNDTPDFSVWEKDRSQY